jgi:hypothetical protein
MKTRLSRLCQILMIVVLVSCHSDLNQPTVTPRPKEFNYPHSVGTRWLYRYHYYLFWYTSGSYEERHGLQQWEVSSVSGYKDSTVALVAVSRTDTVHKIQRYPWSGPPYVINTDTTYVNRQSSKFTITLLADSIALRWTSNTVVASRDVQVLGNAQRLENLARYTDSDTVKYFDSMCSVWYIRGVGLTEYSAGHVSNSVEDESLVLIDTSLKSSIH